MYILLLSCPSISLQWRDDLFKTDTSETLKVVTMSNEFHSTVALITCIESIRGDVTVRFRGYSSVRLKTYVPTLVLSKSQ